MTDPKTSPIVRSGAGALSRPSGFANPIVSRMADDVLRKANENRISQELIQLGRYSFCPQDHKQIIRWAETFGLDSLDLLKIFEEIGDFDVVDGTIMSLKWDLKQLPLPTADWEDNLSIRKLYIRGRFSKEQTGNLRITGKSLSNLEDLTLWGTGPISATVTELPRLEHLRCWSSNLSSLRLKEFPALVNLSMRRNNLKALEPCFSQLLTSFTCNSNNLHKFEPSLFPCLEWLHLNDNQLKTIDLSPLPMLEDLSVAGNRLTSVDLRHVPRLRSLSIYRNLLATLDLSATPLVTSLDCSNNCIKELDLSRVPDLLEGFNEDKHDELLGPSFSCENNPLDLVILTESQATTLSHAIPSSAKVIVNSHSGRS